ncbi:MAG: nucleotidyltransferase family protein [Lysobacterales bacterium]
MSGQARLFEQLRELLAHFDERGFQHALIGGLAVNVHGYARATHDVDFLIDLDDESALHALMLELGYSAIDRREDLSSYVRDDERADFLHAHREIGRRLLAGASRVAYGSLQVPVISAEGLLGFKIQAFSDDPRRLKDLSDMLEIMRACGKSLNWDEVRAYFAVFGREALFDELKRAADPDRD